MRAIVGALGVDKKQVQRDLEVGTVSPPTRVTGADGKSYPASRPRPKLEPAKRRGLRADKWAEENERKMAELQGRIDRLPAGSEAEANAELEVARAVYEVALAIRDVP